MAKKTSPIAFLLNLNHGITAMVTAKWFPELLLVTDIAKRGEVFVIAWKRSLFSPVLLLLAAVSVFSCLIISVGVSIYVWSLFGEYSGFTGTLVNVLTTGLCIVLGLLSFFTWYLVIHPILARRKIRRLLWKELSERGCDICGTCGYDLRGSCARACSECGTPFHPGQKLSIAVNPAPGNFNKSPRIFD